MSAEQETAPFLPRTRAQMAERGWDEDTDIIFTTDHGELQGDYGLLFKGPAHVDSLMRFSYA